ncbi:MAG: hypothetical protein AVDCRST_MAG42-2027, partial [uncultured Chthoniobacterales bacterium]
AERSRGIPSQHRSAARRDSSTPLRSAQNDTRGEKGCL